MPEEVRAAVFGNVGTMITFRVGAFDAEVLEKEFAPYFEAQDLVNLGFVQIYLKLMIDGTSSQPFSARTLPPIERPIVSFKDQILVNSRAMFANPRAVVEANVRDWHDEGHVAAKKSVVVTGPVTGPVNATSGVPVSSSSPFKTVVAPINLVEAPKVAKVCARLRQTVQVPVLILRSHVWPLGLKIMLFSSLQTSKMRLLKEMLCLSLLRQNQ